MIREEMDGISDVSGRKIVAVIPAYNEERFIGSIVLKAHKHADVIVVVDDGSTDGTAEIAADLAEQYPIRVIKRQGVRGLGSAIIEGFRNARGDVVGVIDADLQHPPEVIPRLVEPLRNGSDVAVANTSGA